MNVRALVIGAAVVASLGGVAAADSVKYYGGDLDDIFFPDQNGGGFTSAWIYEDFQWDGGAVTRMFANYLSNSDSIVGMEFEIRSGMSDGDGGTLVASGGGTSLWTNTGADMYRGDLDMADFNLAAGTYMLGLRPIFEGGTDSVAYLGYTFGTNSVGSSGSGSWFVHAPDYGPNYFDCVAIFGELNWSQGIYGVELVPLPPAAWAGMTTLAGLAGFRVVRRRAGR